MKLRDCTVSIIGIIDNIQEVIIMVKEKETVVNPEEEVDVLVKKALVALDEFIKYRRSGKN